VIKSQAKFNCIACPWFETKLHFSAVFFQILQKLLEKLSGEQLQVPEVTQSEEGQRNKLRVVLGFANQVLGLQRSQQKWSVESVHTKNIVSILHLLVSFQICLRLTQLLVKPMVSLPNPHKLN